MQELYSLLPSVFEGKQYSVVTNIKSWSKEDVKFDSLSHFVSMKGINYDESKCRLMVIGRAVNGWGSINNLDSAAFGRKAQEIFEDKGFQWIINDGDKLHNGGGYFLSKSPFWRTVKQIWEGLSQSKQDRWVDYIAWSNLYKIAPPQTGNPTTDMCKRQVAICRDIMRKEIEIYQPTHILFVTGWDWWFHDESGQLGFSELFPDVYHVEKANKVNGVFIEGIGTYHNTKVVVACRPEQCREQEYVTQILKSF